MQEGPERGAILRALAGGAALIALMLVLLALTGWIAGEVKHALGLDAMMRDSEPMRRVLVLALVVLAAMMAVPFLPGFEVGMGILVVWGQGAALLVWGAAVVGLCAAFAVGCLVPPPRTAAALERAGLHRIADLVREAAARPGGALGDAMPRSAPARLVLTHRYVALALALNLPGNVLLGGGGGIALSAGISRLFAPWQFVGAVMLALLPVPVVAWLFW